MSYIRLFEINMNLGMRTNMRTNIDTSCFTFSPFTFLRCSFSSVSLFRCKFFAYFTVSQSYLFYFLIMFTFHILALFAFCKMHIATFWMRVALQGLTMCCDNVSDTVYSSGNVIRVGHELAGPTDQDHAQSRTVTHGFVCLGTRCTMFITT